jgi:Tfp pilus assembly protein PilV
LATVMLLAGAMALAQTAYLARRHATGAEDRTQAQMHCQNIMQELLAGLRPLRKVSPQFMAEGPWLYAIDIEPVNVSTPSTLSTPSTPSTLSTRPALSRITVTVERSDEETASIPREDTMQGYRLVRWVRAAPSAESAWESEPDQALEMLDEVPPPTGFPPPTGGGEVFP